MIWCNLGHPKVCYYQPKINNLKEKNQQENLIAIFLSQINLDEHVSMKINTFRMYKGGLGGLASQKQKNFLKNQTKWRLSLIFFAFWQGSLNPQNYELAKIFTSAPQLPENK